MSILVLEMSAEDAAVDEDRHWTIDRHNSHRKLRSCRLRSMEERAAFKEKGSIMVNDV